MSVDAIDLSLLRLLKYRDNYERLHRAVPKDIIDVSTAALLRSLGNFFKDNPNAEVAKPEDFWPFFRLANPRLKPEGEAVLSRMVKLMGEDVPDTVSNGILKRLQDARLASDMASMLERYQEGDEVSITQYLRTAADTIPPDADDIPYADTNIEALLAEDEDDWGFKWRLNCLNECMRPLRPGDFGILAARVDQGKCLAVGTKVVMADGSLRNVEDVRVGDVLASPFRNNTVTGITRGVSPLYRVTYPWGESYVVNEGHLLSLQRSGNEGKHKAGELKTIAVQDFKPANPKNHRWKGWKSGITLPDKPLPMCPYTLGLWLGDGTSSKPQFTTKDMELLDFLVDKYGQFSNQWDDRHYDFYRTAMWSDLKAAGVANNKHIPEQYLTAGDAQRKALLAGLLDTDGHCTAHGYEFSQKDEQFMRDFVRLVRSLGFHCTYSKEWKRATNGKHVGDWYCRARIGTEVFGQLPIRKVKALAVEAAYEEASRDRKPKRQGNRHSIVVTPEGVGEYAGFGLDGDHLFILEDFTVTHNTTMFTSELTHMAKQAEQLFGERRPILYLNNEGVGSRIVKRAYQAALNATNDELVKLSKQGVLRERYLEAMGGWESFLVVDVHDRPMSFLESVIQRTNPSLVVVDMLDVVPFDGTAMNGGTRTDQILEAAYQRARIWGVKYECAVIAASQLSADASGEHFPTLGMLANSRTGKPGAADFILMLGSSEDPLMADTRWISLPKNKLARRGRKDPRAMVQFDADRARVNNPETLIGR